jgi:acyl transferase domain-containing protein
MSRLLVAEESFRSAIIEFESAIVRCGGQGIVERLSRHVSEGADAPLPPEWIAAFQLALLRLWRHWAVAPDVIIADHPSTVSAGVAAGLWDIVTAAQWLVRRTAELVPPGIEAHPKIRVISASTRLDIGADEPALPTPRDGTHVVGEHADPDAQAAVADVARSAGVNAIIDLGRSPISPGCGATPFRLASTQAGEEPARTLRRSLAALFVQGYPVDLANLHAVALPNHFTPQYPRSGERYWLNGGTCAPERIPPQGPTTEDAP